MRRVLIQVRKIAIVCHRWMGVAFCLLFCWWFVSGIFMMYWDFPSVGQADRMERSPAIDPAQVKLSPAEAYATLGQDRQPASVRLAMFAGRPVYRFGAESGGRGGRRRASSVVYADDGTQPGECTDQLALRIVSDWTKQPGAMARVEEVTAVDQWTIQGQLRALLPLLKYGWPDGEQAYFSKRTCEVVQYTTWRSRLFAELGAIPHWLYYTPLRKNGLLWSRIVIWSSGIATVAALLGLAVGISMYSPSRRYRFFGEPTSIPYRGQKRLHLVFGLFFGIVACTWAFSGMLSMDPFPVPTGGDPGSEGVNREHIAAALRGGRFQMAAFAQKHPRDALKQVASELRVKELEFAMCLGEPVYFATQDSRHMRIVPLDGPPREVFDWNRVKEALESASDPRNLADVHVITDYDAYYLDRRREKPLPVVLARFNDSDQTRYYIDLRTARIVGGYSSQDWMSRWLYHGLHSLNFPWLYNHRPAWDILVLALLLGGTALCVTSIILAWRVLRRKLALAVIQNPSQADDDYVLKA